MYDVGVKQLGRIKSMHVNSLACVRVKEGESERFRIDSGVRRVYHVPMALQKKKKYIYIYNMDTVMVKMGMGRSGGPFVLFLFYVILVFTWVRGEKLRVGGSLERRKEKF